jgi:hypothetical protein
MNRFVLPSALTALALAGMFAVLDQHRVLVSLRDRQRVLLARASTAGAPLDRDAPVIPADASSAPPETDILKARNEVNQLMRRKKELAAVTVENARLRSQLTMGGPNPPSGLSGRFVRRSEARMMGCASPDHALETFLWAVQNQNTQALFEVMSPEAARQLSAQSPVSDNPVQFFKEAEGLIGLRVLGRKQLDDGSVELSVTMPPEDKPQSIRFQQFGNQWKMDLP